MAGYWTPMDGSWVDVMLGTVTAGTGFMFIPSDNVFLLRGMPCFFSTGLEAKYRLGVGNPARYEAYKHTLYLTMPVRFHISLTPQHQLFASLGYVYFFEFFAMTEKYSDSQTHIFYNMGVHAGFGYRFVLNRTLSLFFRNDFDFLINERPLITYAPTLGLDIQIYGKEKVRKW
jgi:hypothetical protein